MTRIHRAMHHAVIHPLSRDERASKEGRAMGERFDMSDWEDVFFERDAAARLRAFNERRRGKAAERAELIEYIAPGLPTPAARAP